MKPPKKTISVQFDMDMDIPQAELSRLESLVRGICEHFSVKNADISIRIVDDEQIRHVHRQYLQKDTATDVVSFDLTDEFEPGQTFQLVVNAQMAARQAAERAHSPEAELALYVTHGLLHNLGFDDGEEKDAQQMHETEDRFLQQHGYGRIYHNETGDK